MRERIREFLLLIAVLVMIVTAVTNPQLRWVSLFFAVIGVGLFLRRRDRRLRQKDAPPPEA